MFNIEVLSLVLMVLSVFLFCKIYEYYMMVLMSLEFFVLVVLFSVYFNLTIMSKEIYYLIFMVFFVVESVLGLSILILMAHYKGNDHVSSMSLSLW